MNQINLNGRHAVVTGAAQGIGLAIVERFLASGASVSLWDRDNELLKETVSGLDYEGAVHHMAIDVTDAEGVVGFPNLEPQVYHILVYKAGTGGYWAFGGNTPDALIQNEINIYFVPCKWFEDTKKRSINEWFKVFKDHPHFKSSLMIPKIN